MLTSESLTNGSSLSDASKLQPVADATINPSENTAESSPESRLMKAMKLQYQADQQMKYLDLQAKMESLLQQLQEMKRQRETVEERTLAEAASR
ncbi:hypothetical protein OsccyDRAFT_3659 [Leptolyngbyaceae cyanobacterium JSC-12]|nr:hypothetical protein OsccyDRAFT_3659 [Leptolyngbyaceae cyanobacterium JSC-12]